MKTLTGLFAVAVFCLVSVAASTSAQAWGNKRYYQCYFYSCGSAYRYAYPRYRRVYERYQDYWRTYPRYYWQGYPTYNRRYIRGY